MATTAHLDTMNPWKPTTAGAEMYQVYRPRPSPKPRHASTSPRYVRTWSQEEEAYLLDARRARVPYKDIAARLNKTDLACRLHYHQMVVARKNAAAEERSTPVPEPYVLPMPYQSRAESLPPLSTTVAHHSLLLPAPIMREPSRSGSGADMLSPEHRRTASQPAPPGRALSSPPMPMGGVAKSISRRTNPNGLTVDINRIQQLYRDLAPNFWSNIAAAYSHDGKLSPSEIESAFWAGQGVRSEPISPSSSARSARSARSTSPSSWPSAMSTSSTMTSQASDEPTFSCPGEPSSAVTNKTRCSVNALLNN